VVDLDSTLYGVACPSVAQCTAVDNSDAEVTFDPRGRGSVSSKSLGGGAGAFLALLSIWG
jgi:hypothetical protein